MAKAFSEYLNFIFQESLNVQAVQTEEKKDILHLSGLTAASWRGVARGARRAAHGARRTCDDPI